MADARLAELDAWLSVHHGVVSRSALLRIGFTSRQADRLVTSQRLVRVHRAIYRSPAHPRTRHQLMAAACLLHPAVAVGFTTAGQEWGLRAMADELVHVLVPHRVKLSIEGVVVHRSRRIDAVDLAGRRADGIRLTSPPRTLVDAAGIIGEERTASALEQVLAEKRCTIGTLMSTSRRLRHQSRPGSRVFDAVLLSRPVWRGAARSHLEIELREAMEQRRMPAPLVNMPFTFPDGEHIEIDLAWPEWKVAVEVDHPFWHDGQAEARRDKQRDRKLAGVGWLPQRVPSADIEERAPEVADELGAVLMSRGWKAHVA